MKPEKLQEFLSEALLESQKSELNFKHGCVILYKGRIVARGSNDHYGHAEAHALNDLEKVYCGLRGQGVQV